MIGRHGWSVAGVPQGEAMTTAVLHVRPGLSEQLKSCAELRVSLKNLQLANCCSPLTTRIAEKSMLEETPTIATLSSIPPRFDGLAPTLRSLLSQSVPFSEIRLYVPKSYRRFPEWNGKLPTVPEGIKIVRCDSDLGPATKILPAARELRGQNIDIIFCDDDKVYDLDWHKRFKCVAREKPNTCIVEAGETFPDIADSDRPSDRLPRGRRARKDWIYRLKRIASLTLHKPHTYRNSGYVDQISGYAGVLVKPDWFSDAAWDIPDIMWTVDDPWLSGHLELAGIPIWLNGNGKQPKSAFVGRISALLNFEEDGFDRVSADLKVISYFRNKYGIWRKSDSVEADFSRMTASMRALVRASSLRT